MVRNTLLLATALVFMIALLPAVGWAQDSNRDQMAEVMANTTPAERAGVQTNLMVEMLSLSDEQIEPVRAINLKYAETAAEIYYSDALGLSKLMKMRKMGKDKDEELKAVLTNEQFETYEESKGDLRDKTMETLHKR